MRNSLTGVLLSAILWAGPSAAQPTLVLNHAAVPPLVNNDGSGVLERIAMEAFERAGLRVELIRLPAERALLNANAGIDDGNLMRIKGLEQLYPNLRRVPEKIWDMEFVALTRNVELRTDAWHRLNPYSVAFIKGWKIFENDAYQPAARISVEDPVQLLTLLKLDRADIVLYERWMGLEQGRRLGIADLRVLEPPLARREMFVYLHKKHEALIPRIADALREMKADGTYQRLFDQLIDSQSR